MESEYKVPIKRGNLRVGGEIYQVLTFKELFYQTIGRIFFSLFTKIFKQGVHLGNFWSCSKYKEGQGESPFVTSISTRRFHFYCIFGLYFIFVFTQDPLNFYILFENYWTFLLRFLKVGDVVFLFLIVEFINRKHEYLVTFV